MTFKDALIRNSLDLMAAEHHDSLLKKPPKSATVENKDNKKSTFSLTASTQRSTTLDVPKAKTFTRREIVNLMRERQGLRTQTEYAAELGISKQLLTEIYMGRRNPGYKLLKTLGLISKTVYEQTA